jgi:hypothetical protein
MSATGLMMGFQAMSSIVGAVGQANALKSQANALDYNAKVEELNARAAEKEAQEREILLRKKGQKALSTQRTQLAGAGLIPGEGSALALLEETTINTEADIQAERYAGKVEALGHRNQAKNLEWQAGETRRAAKAAMGLGFLTGIGNMMSMGMQTGMFSSGGSSMGIGSGIALPSNSFSTTDLFTVRG